MTDDGHEIETLLELLDRVDTAAIDPEAVVSALDSDAPGVGVDGPGEETAYRLARGRLRSDGVQSAARRVTATALAVSPRSPATARLLGIEPFLVDRDANAVETLRDAGVAVDGDSLRGDCPATEAVVEATLRLFDDGLIHAHVLDADGDAITARYDGSHHHFWLPSGAGDRLRARLDAALADAVVQARS